MILNSYPKHKDRKEYLQLLVHAGREMLTSEMACLLVGFLTVTFFHERLTELTPLGLVACETTKYLFDRVPPGP